MNLETLTVYLALKFLKTKNFITSVTNALEAI